MSEPERVLDQTTWWTCPACGNAERGKDNPRAIRGGVTPSFFADGRNGLAKQGKQWDLTCPCGHDWQVEEVATRERRGAAWVVTWAPYVQPAPFTPEQLERREAGQALRDRRVAAGLSLRDLAAMLGVTPAEVSHLEHGQFARDLPEDLAVRYAAHLGNLEA